MTEAGSTIGAYERVGQWIGEALSASVEILALARIQALESRLVTRISAQVDGDDRSFVLCEDLAGQRAVPRLAVEEEFNLVCALHASGVEVPEPISSGPDPDRPETSLALYSAPEPATQVSSGIETVRAVGQALAYVHSISPNRSHLSYLTKRDAQKTIDFLRDVIDRMGAHRPALEWGLRWALCNAPRQTGYAILHGACHAGHIAPSGQGRVQLVDWCDAGLGDPMADLGTFCAACWRQGRPDLEAGGLASRQTLYDGYIAGGGKVDDARVRYWEIVAHLKAAIAIFSEPERPTLNGALALQRLPELELAILRATSPETWHVRDCEVQHVA
ncbi:MAG: phosphotransferase [Pseudomonadota bacterium]